MASYKYGLKLRGFGPWCQPDGWISWRDVDKLETGYHSIVAYPRQLTVKEIKDYEMEEIKEGDIYGTVDD